MSQLKGVPGSGPGGARAGSRQADGTAMGGERVRAWHTTCLQLRGCIQLNRQQDLGSALAGAETEVLGHGDTKVAMGL